MSSESAFEYDEDTEADEAMFESADEADEAVDEADEAADESYEAADEADEAVDEADEAVDEAADEEEGMSLSARLRANKAEFRRAAFARRVAADQRADAQRAAATRRDLSDRLRSIQSTRARVYSVARLQGAGVVTAVLPNGRRTRMRIIPTMAPVAEVNQLRTVLNVNEKRQASATAANSRAIASLGATQSAVVKKLTDQQVMSDRELGKRIVEVNQRLDKRISGELTGQKAALDQNNKKIMRAFKRQRQRALWNSLLLASSAPLFSAYGDRNDPFSRNNLILTGSLLGFLVTDEVIDHFAKGGKSGIARGGATAISYGAPFANAALMYFLLNDKIHDRFLSGITDLSGATPLDVKLTVPKGSATDFKNQPHPAVATIVSALDASGTAATVADIRAIVTIDGDNGKLTLTAVGAAPGTTVKVAWMVEMQPQTS